MRSRRVRRVAAERPYPRPPQRNADREAGRDCALSAELFTAKRITVQLPKVSRRACLSWCRAGRSWCLVHFGFGGAIMTIGVLALEERS
jgi:hypothetical protein